MPNVSDGQAKRDEESEASEMEAPSMGIGENYPT
jgi:hypothetical protein